MGRKENTNIFKPSKRLLTELIKYLSNEKIATLIGNVNPQTISNWSMRYKIKRTNERKIPNMPDWVYEELRLEMEAHERKTGNKIVDKKDECLVVVEEKIDDIPEPDIQFINRSPINTCDIPALIESGNVLDWFYGGIR